MDASGVTSTRRLLRIAIGLAATAAALALVGAATAESPPIGKIYGEPGPVPLPDSVAKEFVDRAAPSLRGVTAEELARGVVVGSPATPTPAPAAAPASSDNKTTPAAVAVSDALLERAGVGRGPGSFDSRWGILLAGVLAISAFGMMVWANRRPSLRRRER